MRPAVAVEGLREVVRVEREQAELVRRNAAEMARQVDRLAQRITTMEARLHETLEDLKARRAALDAPPVPLAPKAAAAPPAGAPARPTAAIGSRIRAARERRHLTRKQLSDAVGCSLASVYIWETGRSQPGLAYARALAKALVLPVPSLRVG